MGDNSTTGGRDNSITPKEYALAQLMKPKEPPTLNVETVDVKLQGYHATVIQKGEYGELSKIKEEVEEALDADKQGNPVMVLLELSDMIAAIDGFLKKHHPTVTLDHLVTMAHTTQRVFESGVRK